MNWPWTRTKKKEFKIVEEKPEEKPLKVSSNTGIFGNNGDKGVNRLVLDDEDKIEICRLAACYEPATQIVEWLKQERSKSVTSSSIYSILKSAKWKPLTEKFRTQFIQGIMEEPLSNKRKRLRYLHRFMEKAESKGSIKDAIDAVDSAREEMEPKHGDFNLQLNQFNMISDEELMEIRNRLEEKLKLKASNKKEIVHAFSERETKEIHGSGIIEAEIGRENSNGNE